jgi:hypothetical protein
MSNLLSEIPNMTCTIPMFCMPVTGIKNFHAFLLLIWVAWFLTACNSLYIVTPRVLSLGWFLVNMSLCELFNIGTYKVKWYEHSNCCLWTYVSLNGWISKSWGMCLCVTFFTHFYVCLLKYCFLLNSFTTF